MGTMPYITRPILLLVLGIQGASTYSAAPRKRGFVANYALDHRAAWLRSAFSIDELENVIELKKCPNSVDDLKACVQALNIGLRSIKKGLVIVPRAALNQISFAGGEVNEKIADLDVPNLELGPLVMVQSQRLAPMSATDKVAFKAKQQDILSEGYTSIIQNGAALTTDFAALFKKINDALSDQDNRSAILADMANIYLRYRFDYHTHIEPYEMLEQVLGNHGESYTGVGVQVRCSDGRCLITAIEPKSPADKSVKIKVGQLVTKISEAGKTLDTTKADAEKVEDWLSGKPGTSVTLTVQSVRAGSAAESVSLTREIVDVENVSAKLLEIGALKIGYLKIRAFKRGPDFVNSVRDELQRLQLAESRGLVVDLRGNRGGMVSSAVDALGLFLDKDSDQTIKVVGNKLFDLKDRPERIRDLLKDDQDYLGLQIPFFSGVPKICNLPLIVLIDAGTASAAEIFAGALRHYDRAFLVGERSFGKGVMQFITENFGKDRTGADGRPKKSIARLDTVAEYSFPDGSSPHQKSIFTDREEPLTLRGPSIKAMREEDLPNTPQSLAKSYENSPERNSFVKKINSCVDNKVSLRNSSAPASADGDNQLNVAGLALACMIGPMESKGPIAAR